MESKKQNASDVETPVAIWRAGPSFFLLFWQMHSPASTAFHCQSFHSSYSQGVVPRNGKCRANGFLFKHTEEWLSCHCAQLRQMQIEKEKYRKKWRV